ncbi:helix-turn-helix transcriptional regulator [Solimonas marina]|uniref:Helix-turn-helix transcriptional regulator n=1 Tax=Solimonas marina TaxID=2714601 RepID=A0A970B7Q3_9GAMM|nr:helix-turn-helix transcriptional regulator [Solimonas marina]NKF21459.1 helix-turn-helix transcriptional regulator [Solimonas marina]
MPQSSPADAIDPVDRLIARLYRSGLMIEASQFRSWALAQLARMVSCDGVLWGSGVIAEMKFQTVTVHGLPPEFPQKLQSTIALNPMLPQILRNIDTPIAMQDIFPDDEFYASELYRGTFAPFGINRLLSTAHLDRRSGLYSLLTLYRKDRNAPFTDDDKLRQKRASYHLFNASSHSLFLHLAQTYADRPANSGAAVVNIEGIFHEAQPRFLDMLDERMPNREVQRLPFPMPAPGTCETHDDLMVRCESLGELYLIIIWPAGPLDRLTAREREIVYSVAQGLSFKQAAKKIGVAPSTVANHLYRVYRKLGVYSRTELAELVHPQSTPPP